MFPNTDPTTCEAHHPALELVRLASPRRVDTQAHPDRMADSLARIRERGSALKGCRVTHAPRLLRHFTARFEPA